jgi:hypothetical protein
VFQARPIIPPVQPMLSRLIELADAFGFILTPHAYELPFTTGALVGRASFIPDAQLGAFVVTTMSPAEIEVSGGTGDDADVEVVVRSGSRLLTEGRVRWKSAFFSSALYQGGQEGPAPVVVLRGDSLQIEATGPAGSTLDATQAVVVGGYHVRYKDGRMAGPAADRFARAVIADGELSVGGVVTTDTQNDGYAVQVDTHIERIVVRGNELGLTSYRTRLGNIDLFPQALGAASANFLLSGEAGLVMQGHVELKTGEQVNVQQVGSGGQVTSLVVVGRRFNS